MIYLEKIFKREDGTKYQIRASVWLDHSAPVYDIDNVYKRIPRKKNWIPVYAFDADYTWRCLSIADRQRFRHEKYLEFVTASEINETFEELWNNLRPTQFLG